MPSDFWGDLDDGYKAAASCTYEQAAEEKPRGEDLIDVDIFEFLTLMERREPKRVRRVRADLLYLQRAAHLHAQRRAR